MFIAPASIPINGAEAIVNVKLLKLLVSEGYLIDLISKKAAWEQYPLMQEEDLRHSLSSVTVLDGDNKIGFRTLWLHFRAWLRFGVLFKGIHWAFLASETAKSLLKTNSCMCVMTKNRPSEVVGYWLKRRYNIPWIATWNDPYPLERYPFPYGKGPQAKLWLLKRPLISQMGKADAHVFPSARLRDYMQSYLHADMSRMFVIPHIVDHSECRQKNDDGILRVCYLGCLDGPRQPWTMLDAIQTFRNSNEDAHFKVDFIGKVPDGMEDAVRARHIDDIVSICPPVSYAESTELLQRYDVALIIEAPCPEGVFLPSKVSDAMAAGMSIFAVSPAVGVLHDLYEDGKIQYFSDVTQVGSIVGAMQLMYSDYIAGRLKASGIPTEYEPVSVGTQYDKIIEMIGQV